MHSVRRITAIALALLALAAAGATAQPAAPDGLKLFKSHLFGSTLEQGLALDGARDCSQGMSGPTLCLPEPDFLGQEWNLLLEYTSDRLTQVTLIAPFSRHLYLKALSSLAKSFRMVAMQSDQPPLDLAALEYAQGREALFAGEVAEYEARGLAAGSLAYVFLEREGLRGVDPAPSALELRRAAPRSLREAALVLSTDGDGGNWLVLTFSRPGLLRAEDGADAATPDTDF